MEGTLPHIIPPLEEESAVVGPHEFMKHQCIPPLHRPLPSGDVGMARKGKGRRFHVSCSLASHSHTFSPFCTPGRPPPAPPFAQASSLGRR